MTVSPNGALAAETLRDQREALVTHAGLRGREFGEALADLVDAVLRDVYEASGFNHSMAVVAFGSYGRRELCPGSDIDVALIHAMPRRKAASVRELAEKLWYPLWDAGLVTGHGARTVKESLALASDETDALTAMLQARHVAGDEELTLKLLDGVRTLAAKRRDRLIDSLGAASSVRRAKPGPIAEMLEPDLKDGSGGLRDIQSLSWVGWALGAPGGVDALVERHYLTGDDLDRLEAAEERLLDVRVALHRLTSGRNDLLVLQEQDAVAESLGVSDADELVRSLAGSGREVAWIAREAFERLSVLAHPPSGRVARHDRPVSESVVEREGKVAITAPAPIDALTVLDAAGAAAEAGVRFERRTVELLATMKPPTWDVWERAAFIRLLRAGDGALDVFEALDHAGALVRLLPEWEAVRSLPQRNAYHRFTVDRHLLETVARCAELLEAGDTVADLSRASIEESVVRACRRPELLLLAALLHDIGKGTSRDHSAVGAKITGAFARRIGLDAEGREILTWLVRDHLLMADTAARRDLTDEVVVERFADHCVGDPERLRLLYLLTIGDSIATGPAAWSSTKEALLRDLFVKAVGVIEQRGAGLIAEERRVELAAAIGADEARRHLARLPDSYGMAFDAADMTDHHELLVRHDTSVRCQVQRDGRLAVTVAAPDRRGLLATVAGALTVSGLSVNEAYLFSTSDGWALDVFRADDPFGRYAEGATDKVEQAVSEALTGDVDVESALHRRAAAYRRDGAPGPVHVTFDLDGSDATIVEVDASDDLGVLYRLADTFAAEDLDVLLAKVSTLGERVVDVFYVVDADGQKLTDPEALSALRRALETRLAS